MKLKNATLRRNFWTFIILITSYKTGEIPRQMWRFSLARSASAEGSPGCFSHQTEPWDLQPSWRWFSPPADCRSPWSCRPGPVRPPRSGRWKSLGGKGSKPRTIWNKKNITHLTFLAFRESGLRLDDPTHCFAALKVWDNKLSTPTSLPTSHFPLPNWNFTLYCGSESPGWYC